MRRGCLHNDRAKKGVDAAESREGLGGGGGGLDGGAGNALSEMPGTWPGARGGSAHSATRAHAAGADLKDIQEVLGHSSITITADTYPSFLPETDRAIPEAAARLFPRARRTEQAAADDADLESNEEPEAVAVAVADGAGESAAEPGPGAPSAHAPRARKRPRTKSPRPKKTPPWGETPGQRLNAQSPLSDSNRRPSLYKSGALTS